MSKAQLLEDIFEVLEKDPDGKKFDKGGRRQHVGGMRRVAALGGTVGTISARHSGFGDCHMAVICRRASLQE